MKLLTIPVMILILLSLISLVTAGNYSINSYHQGNSGARLTGASVSGRSTVTYQQGGEKDTSSSVYSLNLGWFKKASNDSQVSEETSIETGGSSGGGGGGSSGRILFDVDILEFESQIPLGGFFDFTYFIKGVGDINDDIFIDFWIEKDEVTISSGSAMIYMRSNDEIVRNASLLLPKNLESGGYKIVVKATYKETIGEAHRSIWLEVDEDTVTIQPLFDISFTLNQTIIERSQDLVAITTFTNFKNISTTVHMNYTILDSLGNIVYKDQEHVTVIHKLNIRKQFLDFDVSKGEYTIILSVLHSNNTFDEFIHNFEIKPKRNVIWYLFSGITFLLLILLLLFLKRRKKKTNSRRNKGDEK